MGQNTKYLDKVYSSMVRDVSMVDYTGHKIETNGGRRPKTLLQRQMDDDMFSIRYLFECQMLPHRHFLLQVWEQFWWHM